MNDWLNDGLPGGFDGPVEERAHTVTGVANAFVRCRAHEVVYVRCAGYDYKVLPVADKSLATRYPYPAFVAVKNEAVVMAINRINRDFSDGIYYRSLAFRGDIYVGLMTPAGFEYATKREVEK